MYSLRFVYYFLSAYKNNLEPARIGTLTRWVNAGRYSRIELFFPNTYTAMNGDSMVNLGVYKNLIHNIGLDADMTTTRNRSYTHYLRLKERYRKVAISLLDNDDFIRTSLGSFTLTDLVSAHADKPSNKHYISLIRQFLDEIFYTCVPT